MSSTTTDTSQSQPINVLQKPLIIHSLNPVTGYFRNGFCDTDASDTGNHTIAGILTNDFLDFTAARGNDLRKSGLFHGCRWCLCVSRWREAYQAFKEGHVKEETVPRVVLEATHIRASETVPLSVLKEMSKGTNNQFWLSGNREMEKWIVKDVWETDKKQGDVAE